MASAKAQAALRALIRAIREDLDPGQKPPRRRYPKRRPMSEEQRNIRAERARANWQAGKYADRKPRQPS